MKSCGWESETLNQDVAPEEEDENRRHKSGLAGRPKFRNSCNAKKKKKLWKQVH